MLAMSKVNCCESYQDKVCAERMWTISLNPLPTLKRTTSHLFQTIQGVGPKFPETIVSLLEKISKKV